MADRAARERIVQEHVERELAHDLEALVQTFTDASSWEDLAAAEGFFVHVYVDGQTRRPVPIPQVIRSALERL